MSSYVFPPLLAYLLYRKVQSKDQGLTSFEVSDDGSGIDRANYAAVARKHHTSKISQLSDLLSVETFGFRGEALASLCALCERVTITTATAEEALMGTVLQFARSGELESLSQKVARQRGTTVLAEKLFAPLPVRQRELERMIKRDFSRALQLLQAYALVPSVGGAWLDSSQAPRGVRLTGSNQTGKGPRQNQIQSAPLALPDTTVDPLQRLRANVSQVWRLKTLEHFVPLELDFTVPPEKSVLKKIGKKTEGTSDELQVRVRGLISKFAHMSGRLTSERQFFYLNGRPFEPKQIQKAFNEVYKSFNSTQMPMVIADFQLPGDTFDINVSPDKRMFMLHNKAGLITSLKTALETAFVDARSTYQVNDGKLSRNNSDETKEETSTQTKLTSQTNPPRPNKKIRLASPEIESQTPASRSKDTISGPPQTPKPLFRPDPFCANRDPPFKGKCITCKICSNGALDFKCLMESSSQSRSSGLPPSTPPPLEPQESPPSSDSGPTRTKYNPPKPGLKDRGAAARSAFRERLAGMALPGSQPVAQEVIDSDEEDELVEEEAVPTLEGSEATVGSTIISSPEQDHRPAIKPAPDPEPMKIDPTTKPPAPATRTPKKPRQHYPTPELETRPAEFVKTSQLRSGHCGVDMERLKRLYRNKVRQPRSETPAPAASPALKTDWENDDSVQAEQQLSRVIQKQDFLSMDILGQINLGFIIVRLRKKAPGGGSLDDLFIVDQHAADEKFNYERLQRTTKIQSQRLIKPKVLELSIVDELTAIDNMDVLNKNGFVIQVDKEAAEDERPKVRLVAQPMSKDTIFDMKDLEEMLHQMKEGNASDTIRCSKARAMFAMRACRSSIMIGTALKHRHMINMVRNLAGMDQPWNCPHGRPTMRHLCNLQTYQDKLKSESDWKAFSALKL
ncbi:DNA mismatch repair protein PMS1 [Rhizoctonia solani]|uniref:DNA mismatch repair protein PMS1 n=1 Tax=Rhizoctonia solani TaxID=456999 RepID=A0A0K6G510_9AGAM|nr:DNA mismatch repair protein PMS1 [Rhizoctonia solani]